MNQGLRSEDSNNLSFTAAAGFAVLLLAVKTVFAVHSAPLAWGINYFTFLPPVYLWVFAAANIIVLIAARKFPLRQVERLAEFMERKPGLVVGATIGLFIAAAILFRVRIPLLGDSFILIKNYVNTLNGAHSLHLSREPLALYFFYPVMQLFGTTRFPAMMDAFLYGELVLGTGFIVMAYFIVRTLFTRPAERLLGFAILLSAPYMQLFSGYVEIYSVVLVVLTAFVLIGVQYCKKRIAFPIFLASFILLICTHLLAIILLPAVIYAGCLEYRRSGWKILVITCAALAALALMVAALGGLSLRQYLPHDSSAHYLSITPARDDQYQVYGLFSTYHCTDILNLLLLESPFVVFLLPFLFRRSRAEEKLPAATRFIALCAALFLGFVLIAKFDLGMATDWDVSAPWFFLFNLLFALLYFRGESPRDTRIIIAVGLLSLLHTASYLVLNSSERPGIDRAHSLIDERIVPPGGVFLGYTHLAEYFAATGTPDTAIDLWNEYIGRHPTNPMGYHNLLAEFQENNRFDIPRLETFFQQWLKNIPENVEAKREYANFYAARGYRDTRNGAREDAERDFLRSLQIDSVQNFDACNGLAFLYTSTNRFQDAKSLFLKALAIDSTKSSVYPNLAYVYSQLRDFRTAIPLYEKSIQMDPSYTPAYSGLGIAYASLGDTARALVYFDIGIAKGDNVAKQLREMIRREP